MMQFVHAFGDTFLIFEKRFYNINIQINFHLIKASWCFKSPATRPFIQPLIQANNKGNTKALCHWLFVRGIHWWPVDSPHKGLEMPIRFHVVTSPYSTHLMPPFWRMRFVETLVCAPAPFQSPGMGLGSKDTVTPKSSATRWRMNRDIHRWSPISMPSQGPTWNSHCKDKKGHGQQKY